MTKEKNKNKSVEYISLDDTDNYWYSHDIGLVAFLLCKKLELAGLDKAIKSKVLFIVKREKRLDQAIKNYWAFKAPVDAQSYFNQLKRLKNQIFSSN